MGRDIGNPHDLDGQPVVVVRVDLPRSPVEPVVSIGIRKPKTKHNELGIIGGQLGEERAGPHGPKLFARCIPGERPSQDVAARPGDLGRGQLSVVLDEHGCGVKQAVRSSKLETPGAWVGANVDDCDARESVASAGIGGSNDGRVEDRVALGGASYSGPVARARGEAEDVLRLLVGGEAERVDPAERKVGRPAHGTEGRAAERTESGHVELVGRPRRDCRRNGLAHALGIPLVVHPRCVLPEARDARGRRDVGREDDAGKLRVVLSNIVQVLQQRRQSLVRAPTRTRKTVLVRQQQRPRPRDARSMDRRLGVTLAHSLKNRVVSQPSSCNRQNERPKTSIKRQSNVNKIVINFWDDDWMD